ncbi:MAG: DUF924 family protein [Enterobacteriaceae bacterium]
MQAHEIIHFWFVETEPRMWFRKDTAFDQLIRQRYAQWHLAATRGELAPWRVDIHGRLAEIIVLDQFSRNLFRDTAKTFAYDGMALILAQEAVASGQAVQLDPQKRSFLYMPYMHSESPWVHQQAVPLFEQLNLPEPLRYELRHKAIIDQFGRYPYRNEILGRVSSEAEKTFLTQPNSSF